MQKKTMVVLVLLALVAALPQVLQVKYFIHLAVLAMLWAMVAQGTNFIQGYAGYVSIVQGGFMGVGAYSSAGLSRNTGLRSGLRLSPRHCAPPWWPCVWAIHRCVSKAITLRYLPLPSTSLSLYSFSIPSLSP